MANKNNKTHLNRKKVRRLRCYINWHRRLFSAHASFWIIVFGLLLIILALVIFFWNESLSIGGLIKAEKIGQLGDFIGGIVGSVWALSGVILFYVALTLQRREFQLQRQELKETRNIFEQQAKQFKFQQQENTFFNLLEHHSKIISGISKKDTSGSGDNKETIMLSGYQAFTSIWDKLKSDWKYYNADGQNKTNYDSRTLRRNHPWVQISKFDSFRQIYYSICHILFFIEHNLNDNVFYYKTLFNSLSSEEREIMTVLNEYCAYMDTPEYDFSKHPISFNAQIQHLEWFIPKTNLTPLLDLQIYSLNIPLTNKLDKHFQTNGRITFEDNMKLIELGIKFNSEVERNLMIFNQDVKKYDSIDFHLNKEIIEEIEQSSPKIGVMRDGARNENYIYITTQFNGKLFKITCAVYSYTTNNETVINFST